MTKAFRYGTIALFWAWPQRLCPRPRNFPRPLQFPSRHSNPRLCPAHPKARRLPRLQTPYKFELAISAIGAETKYPDLDCTGKLSRVGSSKYVFSSMNRRHNQPAEGIAGSVLLSYVQSKSLYREIVVASAQGNEANVGNVVGRGIPAAPKAALRNCKICELPRAVE
jgi:hypothetical protein